MACCATRIGSINLMLCTALIASLSCASGGASSILTQKEKVVRDPTIEIAISPISSGNRNGAAPALLVRITNHASHLQRLSLNPSGGPGMASGWVRGLRPCGHAEDSCHSITLGDQDDTSCAEGLDIMTIPSKQSTYRVAFLGPSLCEVLGPSSKALSVRFDLERVGPGMMCSGEHLIIETTLEVDRDSLGTLCAQDPGSGSAR